jgi:ABC-2 type transport system permease protein
VLGELYRRRALIWAFANRDFATRYRSSILGWAWSLMQPLATLLVYAAVFSLVFRIQAPPLGSDPDRTNFAAFLFTGMVAFNLFSSLLMLSMTQLKSNGELLRKVHFPAWTPILGASVVQLVQVGLELVVLVGMYLWLGNIGISWLLVLPVLLATALFGQGVGLLLTVLNARYGDVQYIVQVVLQALYFLTPILYPLSLVQGTADWLAVIVEANPLTWFVETMHQIMYSLVVPEWWVVPGLLALGFAVFWLGFTVFNRTSEDIGELL